MNIIEALDSPTAFKAAFPGGEHGSWGPWRTFLRSLFALPLDDDGLARYRHHTGRTDAPVEPFSEATLVCGRRAGKSRILALLGVYLACFVDYSDRLAPGEVGTVFIIAADRVQAKVIFRYILGSLRSVPMLAHMIENETQETVTLNNGVMITVQTNNYRTVRGASLICCLCDETSFWRSEESSSPDFDVLAAVRPGLATLNGLLLIASSAFAKKGALYQSYVDHFGKNDAPVLVWHATSRDMNQTLPQSVVDKAMLADPSSASAEYLSLFRQDVQSWLDRKYIDAVTYPGRYEIPCQSGVKYYGFCDPSGGLNDSMTLAIAHREGEIAVLDLIRERKSPFSPDDVVAEFADTLKGYGLRSVVGDRYSGSWVPTSFANAGITYTPSEHVKSELYKELLPLIMGGKVALLESDTLLMQMANLERRTARGGRESVDHPQHGGARDDVANAVAGSLVLAANVASTVDLWVAMGEAYGSGQLGMRAM